MGFNVQQSQANFVWCTHPKQHHHTLYEQLKAQGILVRYMEYPALGRRPQDNGRYSRSD